MALVNFADVPTNLRLDRLNQITGFFIGVILLWVYTNFASETKNAGVFMFMLVVWGFLAVIETVGTLRADAHLDVIGLGKKPVDAFLYGILALPVMIFLFQYVPLPPYSIVISDSLLKFLYTVIAAPFAEANFFRGIIMPALQQYAVYLGLKLPRNIIGIVAVVLQAVGFALFHLLVFQGAIPQLWFTFLFGLIAGLGVYFTRSIAFEYGLHGLNNLLAFIGGT